MDHVHRFPQPTKRERESQGERETTKERGASVKGSKGNLSMTQNYKNILQQHLLIVAGTVT